MQPRTVNATVVIRTRVQYVAFFFGEHSGDTDIAEAGGLREEREERWRVDAS